MVNEELKYPIGQYNAPENISIEDVNKWISTLKEIPNRLSELVSDLSYDQLDWVYRPGGWQIKQVVHHLADSHMNNFIRFKLAMTEENPTIRSYHEDRWAKTQDATNAEIYCSLDLLTGLHARMCILFRSMDATDLKRTFYHPEFKKNLTLDWILGLYAWHSRHHIAHIQQAIAHEGNFQTAESE